MNPLLIKLREYKLSRPSSFCQDGWILASFLFFVFMDRDFVSVYRNAKKKNSANIQPFWPHAWSIAQMNIFHADPHKSGKGRQCKKCTSEPGIWPWSDITIFATPYLVIRLHRKSATPRGPLNICLLEQVKFKPSSNLTQARKKKKAIKI